MKADTPQVSVALCTWNGARFLEEQLVSVLAQEDVDLEVIAVDDASQDDSVAILQRFAARDPRLRVVVHERNRGATASFEHAMSLARAELIAPCDQDDRWDPRKLARLVDAIDGHDLAYCDSALLDDAGADVGRTIASGRRMVRGSNVLALLFGNSVSGHAMLVRRSLFEQARPFPAGVFHDWWLALRAAGGAGIAYVDAPLVGFRRHAGASSGIEAVRNRRGDWLGTRRAVIHAYATRAVGRDAAAVRALDAALGGVEGTPDPRAVLRWCWHHRRALPGLAPALKLLRQARRAARR